MFINRLLEEGAQAVTCCTWQFVCVDTPKIAHFSGHSDISECRERMQSPALDEPALKMLNGYLHSSHLIDSNLPDIIFMQGMLAVVGALRKQSKLEPRIKNIYLPWDFSR